MSLPMLLGVHFEHTLLRSPGWNLVLFASASCGACKRLRPVLPLLQAVRLWEVDAHDEPALAARFGVFHLPALVLFDGADFHAVVEASFDPRELADRLAWVSRQPAQEEP